MKNNFVFAHMNIICIAIMTIALLSAGMMENYSVRLWIAACALAIVGSIYAAQSFLRRSDFTIRTIALLTKAGIACKRKEDGIVVKQGDVVMKAKLWKGTHGMKRVHFMFDFAPNIIDSVSPEGWALLAAECNANYDHTMVKFYGDHFSCMVETSVKSAKDFLEEYRFAFEKINETMQGMQENADKVTNPFRVKKKQIGFVIPEHE